MLPNWVRSLLKRLKKMYLGEQTEGEGETGKGQQSLREHVRGVEQDVCRGHETRRGVALGQDGQDAGSDELRVRECEKVKEAAKIHAAVLTLAQMSWQ